MNDSYISTKSLNKQLDEAYNMGIEDAILVVNNMHLNPVNDDSANFYWGIDKDELVIKLQSLKK